jgi:hypothetical protein
VALALLVAGMLAWGSAMAGEGGETKSAGGVTVYLGVVPAEIVKGPSFHPGERPMHGGPPTGSHEHHIVAAIYNSSNNARITDAAVTAKVSGLGLSGPQKELELMNIADTVTYGAFFNLPPDLYTIRLTVQRPGSAPVVMDFKYDHRRQ